MNCLLLAVPAFADNYIWLLVQKNQAWAVDPGDAAPVLDALQKRNLTHAGILITHHHDDHTGGVKELLKVNPVPVYGPHNSSAHALINHPLESGQSIVLGSMHFSVIAVPGHTLDHIAFYCESEKILFCGDTLFSAGCGRVFEGSYEQMYDSLLKLANLPDATKICCAHEYTQSNLCFAASIEPDNKDIQIHTKHCAFLRSKNEPTLPSTIKLEKKINPFLRSSNLAVFSERRELKNRF